MPRPLRIAAALAALLALASCSRVYLVRAVFIDGAIGFVSDRTEGGGEPWCLSSFAVVDERGRSVWELEWPASRGAGPCGDFPMVYGRLPAGAQTHAPPRPIEPGGLYAIEGYGGDPVEGAFRYRVEGRTRRLENVDPRDEAVVEALQRSAALRHARYRAAAEAREQEEAKYRSDEPVYFNIAAPPASRKR